MHHFFPLEVIFAPQQTTRHTTLPRLLSSTFYRQCAQTADQQDTLKTHHNLALILLMPESEKNQAE
jgi:hypothetical protein